MSDEITTLEDQKNGVRRFDTENGPITIDGRLIAMNGLAATLKALGVKRDHRLLPVFWHGDEIGTLPASWSAEDARGTLMYEPRAGDFKREGDKWIADPMLGSGDLLHAGVHFTKMRKPEW